jgi:hypothetical protein
MDIKSSFLNRKGCMNDTTEKVLKSSGHRINVQTSKEFLKSELALRF